MLKSLLPDEVKIKITFDDIRLRSPLTTNKEIRFTDKSPFHTFLGSAQSHLGVLGDIKGFIQLIPCTCKCDTPIDNSHLDKVALKCDCFNGSFVDGVRQTILYYFTLNSAPGHKIYNQPRIKLYKGEIILLCLLKHFL